MPLRTRSIAISSVCADRCWTCIARKHGIDGAVLSASAFALRFFTEDHAADRVLVVNLGGDLHRSSIAEPLLAPPAGSGWTLAWCSEDPAYGGGGVPDVLPASGHWLFPAESAVLLA